MPFLSDAEKMTCDAMLNECFDTYKTTIRIFCHPLQSITAVDNSQFNFAFGDNTGGLTYSNVPQFFDVLATVEYMDIEREEKNSYPIDSAKLKNAIGLIRVSIDISADKFMKNAEKIEITGISYEILSGPIIRGLFGAYQIDYYLGKIDTKNG